MRKGNTELKQLEQLRKEHDDLKERFDRLYHWAAGHGEYNKEVLDKAECAEKGVQTLWRVIEMLHNLEDDPDGKSWAEALFEEHGSL